MDFLITIAAIVVAITLLWAIVTLVIKLKLSRELRQKTRLEIGRASCRERV